MLSETNVHATHSTSQTVNVKEELINLSFQKLSHRYLVSTKREVRPLELVQDILRYQILDHKEIYYPRGTNEVGRGCKGCSSSKHKKQEQQEMQEWTFMDKKRGVCARGVCARGVLLEGVGKS